MLTVSLSVPLLPLTSPKVACTDSYKLEPDCVVQTTQYGVHCVFLACVFTDFIKQSFASKYPPMITLRKTGKSQCFKGLDFRTFRTILLLSQKEKLNELKKIFKKVFEIEVHRCAVICL